MKLQRKLIVRNLVLAVIVADGVGLYFLKDRLSNPLQDSAAAFEAEALAAERAEAKALTPAAPAELASRELPKPAFGSDAPASVAVADAVSPVAVKSAAPQVAAAPVAAPALAKAPAAAKVAVPAARPAAKVAPAVAMTAKRAVQVPRAVAAAIPRTPVTLSVTPSSQAKLAKAPERKRTGFKKAFSGISRSAPVLAVTTASGSLHQSAPVITAEFAPAPALDATQPVAVPMEVTTLAMASQGETVIDQTPTEELSGPVESEPTVSELPVSDE